MALLAASVPAGGPDAVGGGFAGGGLEGEYFANADLSGTPAFTRRDVRIEFDWGELLPVGGSTTNEYQTFPRDNFSVRWTGGIIPRFSEDYTFKTNADDGVRVAIREQGSQSWSTIIDKWSASGTFESNPQSLRAGTTYDIRIEYRELSGPARCILRWYSNSTPVEIVDPVTQQALNHASWAKYLWADLTKVKRYGKNGDQVDENGYPTADGVEYVAGEMSGSDVELSGTYLMRFNGKAQIRRTCCSGLTFKVGDQEYANTLPAGAGYDPAENLTTALFIAAGSRTMFAIEQTSRDGSSSGTGITNLSLMRPLSPGSTEHHRPDEIVYRPMKKVIQEHYTCLRYLGIANNNSTPDWASRTKPSHIRFSDGEGGENWEYLIMLANETGSDMYICTPVNANDEYLEKLAELLRYGSDGDQPYSSPQENPVYPPLNPNLRVYIEIGNEIWNWSFKSTKIAQELCVADSAARNANWEIINYDGNAGNAGWARAVRRWHAIRTVKCCLAFRTVYGDKGFGARFRPLMEYQYDNKQNTALHSYQFLDNYYNNGSGNHVDDPHPVNYYLWGGGGATYYGVGNRTGVQSATVAADASFESVSLSANSLQMRPSGSAWTFTGDAGIFRQGGSGEIDGIANLDPAPDGDQAAFILDTGSISQEIEFKHAGDFALIFNAAGAGDGWPGYNPFYIYVDGKNASPRGQTDIRVSEGTVGLGGWSRNTSKLEEEWGSAVFNIPQAGKYTVEFKGRGKRNETGALLMLDNIRIASVDSIMESGFGSGQALGQAADSGFADRCNIQSIYTRTFGLQLIAYEAGWSVGGDFHQKPIQNWCKLKDPRAKRINNEAEAIWDRSGSFMNVWGVYTYWPTYDFENAHTYPIMQSFQEIADTLREEPAYGINVPGTVLPDDVAWKVGKELDAPGEWWSWMLVASMTGQYTIEVDASAGGSMNVEIDGTVVGTLAASESGADNTFSTVMTKGAHAIRIVNTGGSFEVNRIVFTGQAIGVLPRNRGDATILESDVAAALSASARASLRPTESESPPASATVSVSAAETVNHAVLTENENPDDQLIALVDRLALIRGGEPRLNAEASRRVAPPRAVRGDDLTPPVPPSLRARTVPRHDMGWKPPHAAIDIHSARSSTQDGPNVAVNTIDQDLRTRWSPGDAGEQWIEYDLGSIRKVTGATMVWYSLYPTHSSVRVEVSQGNDEYSVVHEGALAGAGTSMASFAFEPRTARRVRIRLLPHNQSPPVHIYDAAIHAPVSPAMAAD